VKNQDHNSCINLLGLFQKLSYFKECLYSLYKRKGNGCKVQGVQSLGSEDECLLFQRPTKEHGSLPPCFLPFPSTCLPNIKPEFQDFTKIKWSGIMFLKQTVVDWKIRSATEFKPITYVFLRSFFHK